MIGLPWTQKLPDLEIGSRASESKCRNGENCLFFASLGHTNLIFCFMSRIARKSDTVGRKEYICYEYQ